MNWKSYAVSDTGNKRAINQDAYFCHDNHGVWLVADGMGGHEDGEIASQTIVQSIANLCESGKDNIRTTNITSMLEDVNQQIHHQNIALNRTVGSTIAMVMMNEDSFSYLWAGDSRIYLYRDKSLEQITTDHSYIQELLKLNKIAQNDAKHHKQRNLITRAIGIDKTIELESGTHDLQTGDKLLICTDGLYSELSSQEIATILEHDAPNAAAINLKKVCLSREASDNVSFIIIGNDS